MMNFKKILGIFLVLLLAFNFVACGNNSGGGGDNTEKKFTITWKNHDGSVLEIDRNVERGTTPSYNGTTPTKVATSDYSYVFSGWSPSVGVVSGAQEYTAQFTAILNTLNVSINPSNWGKYFSFSIKLNNVNRNIYKSTIQEQLSNYYIPNFVSTRTSYSTNVTVSGYITVKIGYTTDDYKNIQFKNYNVYFTHFLYENQGYYSTSVVSLYHNIGTSTYSTISWVVNVEAYLTNMYGTISIY